MRTVMSGMPTLKWHPQSGKHQGFQMLSWAPETKTSQASSSRKLLPPQTFPKVRTVT